MRILMGLTCAFIIFVLCAACNSCNPNSATGPAEKTTAAVANAPAAPSADIPTRVGEPDKPPTEPKPSDAAAQLPSSMKGYELYSWRENGEWFFALLPGTNRSKYAAEIKNAEMKVAGVDAAIRLVKRIPKGDYLFWTADSPACPDWTNEMPSADEVEKIKSAAKENGVILSE